MPWKIADQNDVTVAESGGFQYLPLSSHFPGVGFVQDPPEDFTFSENGYTVSHYTPEPVVPTPPTPDEMLAALEYAVTMHVDGVASARKYGLPGVPMSATLSLVSYEGDTNPRYANDAAVFKAWRGTVWDTCFTVMTEVEAQTRPIPTELELLNELPPFPGF